MGATKHIVLAAATLFFCVQVCAQQLLTDKKETGSFPIVSGGVATIIVVDKNDVALVQKVAALLQEDIERVSGVKPQLANTIPASAKNIIAVGSISKKLGVNISDIEGKWEAYKLQVVKKPAAGIDQALIIAGSDRRGIAFGVFELSQQMGVSPWYWWADVPVKKKKEIYVKKGAIVSDAPLVKYRGIFINDEAPALSGWSKEKFGGFNHLFYEKVFELMLRLKSNYLWPAMWGNAFYDDDKLNQQTADEYGIVIGTSHHEPLMRAHDEWRRYGKGKWNYDSNEIRLKDFWREGLQRANKTEKIVSIGMRGDGDEPMTRETATALLERIVKDQRTIIEDVTGKPAAETPQLWALYKEVQDYYDKGMRVPDDVTLLLCDDNWGNIRRLPQPGEAKRRGGYGIYYHFDYVGGPRNYKWINTNNISRVWEQMHLAWIYGAQQIWIVNVGDIKPMELPISFFLDYAWNPEKIKAEDISAYHENWARQQFGNEHAKEIAQILIKYTQYNSRRKPELLSHQTYSITNYDEWNRVNNEYQQLLAEAERINKALPKEYGDAYYQLVLHPVQASANLYAMYYNVALNHHYAGLKNAVAAKYSQQAREAYLNDSLITLKYHSIGGGKWNHMMAQTHIGYTYWQQPLVNRMPALKEVPADSIVSQAIFSSTNEGGYVSIEAAHFMRAVNYGSFKWLVIPNIGRTASGLTFNPMVTFEIPLGNNNPRVEYEVTIEDTGSIGIYAYFSPTLNLFNDDGLKYAISIDDEQPQIISINKEDNNVRTWEGWVANNIIIKKTTHTVRSKGKHVVKYWFVSPAVVLQKIVIDTGALKPSYLGPPETLRK
jgi:hypothetical protein